MKSKKKVLVTLLCAALLVFASVMGTLAYLKAETGVVSNTFTVGSVAINLNEAPVDQYGNVIEGERVKANSYKLIPGHEYTKDPTVYVTSGSEEAYVFVKVVNGLSAIEADTTIEDQMDDNKWKQLVLTNEDGTTTTVENVFYYETKVDAREEMKSLPVFGKFTLTDTADVASYANAKITIDAYAVQADGFNDAADAWAKAAGAWEN